MKINLELTSEDVLMFMAINHWVSRKQDNIELWSKWCDFVDKLKIAVEEAEDKND